MDYAMLADITVAVHVAYVACVLFGLLFILAGGMLGWTWVKGRIFRTIHLCMILAVVVRSWFCTECPMTTWENDFRTWAGQNKGSDIGFVLHNILHPGWDSSVYPPIYVGVALLVIATMWFVPVVWHENQLGAIND